MVCWVRGARSCAPRRESVVVLLQELARRVADAVGVLRQVLLDGLLNHARVALVHRRARAARRARQARQVAQPAVPLGLLQQTLDLLGPLVAWREGGAQVRVVHGGRLGRQVGHKPGVHHDLLQLDALVGVGQQHALQQVAPLCADLNVVGQAVLHVDHLVQHLQDLRGLGHVLAGRRVKGVAAVQHDVQHDPARPDVRHLAVVLAVAVDQHLGRHVRQRAHLALGC
mmetsp:Transcript_29356/g.74811  ORF Transcript_29356/g.74811 Transcript_29356/m.74811 type:complete len:227 (+) Transcript_29356:820-1500(+)